MEDQKSDAEPSEREGVTEYKDPALARLISYLLPGFVRNTSAASKARWTFTVLVTLASAVLIVEVSRQKAFTLFERNLADLAVAAAASAPAYFFIVVVTVIFLTDRHFKVHPTRLAVDAMVSSIFTIVCFSILYRDRGISLTEGCDREFSKLDSLYFSAVTFSTLGYGDFRPCPEARLWAALEALLGNLHLGVMVGAAFMLAASGGQLELSADDKRDGDKRNHTRGRQDQSATNNVEEGVVSSNTHRVSFIKSAFSCLRRWCKRMKRSRKSSAVSGQSATLTSCPAAYRKPAHRNNRDVISRQMRVGARISNVVEH